MAFLAAAAPILSLIGTGVSAIGTVGAGMYSAQVAENNRKVAEQNAQYAEQAGHAAAADASLKGAQREAKVKTAIAANGIDINTGSAVDVEESQKLSDQLDVERILHDAGLTAYGYRTDSANFEAQAGQDRLAAITGATSTLLEGASAFPTKFPNFGQKTSSSWAPWAR